MSLKILLEHPYLFPKPNCIVFNKRIPIEFLSNLHEFKYEPHWFIQN